LVPLVSAIAAGNCCILKPSELSPATAAVLKELIAEIFDPQEVTVVEGPVDTATALLELPFHHIFFTGSPRVGKIVMQAAAQHLASCTLELGGKSPAYIGKSASLKTAARRIAWGKCTNAGQTCIAPDYILVSEAVKQDFVNALIQEWKSFYPQGAEASQDLTKIVNSGHFSRLKLAMDEAVQNGAQILYGGNSNSESLFMEPTLIDNLTLESSLMQEEIFGPILPIVSVSGPEEALSVIQTKERPLSFYIFSRNNREIKLLEQQTHAGGTCVNHNLIHYANLDLPFGGINNSGMGKSHGFAGFLEFSHQRPVLRQYLPSMAELVRPPYSNFRKRLAEWTMRWL
jgi:aldehyde dehydrogenase (NAD+)